MKLNKNIIAIVPDLVVFTELAPMGYYLGKKLVLIDIFDVVKNSEFSKKIISKINIIRINQSFSTKLNILLFFEKLMKKFSVNIQSYFEYVYSVRNIEITHKFEKVIDDLHKDKNFDSLLIRAGNDLLTRSLIHSFRSKGFNGKVIGISQAIPALSNVEHNKYRYKFPTHEEYFNKDYSLVHDCDHVISNSKTYINIYKKMKIPFIRRFKIIDSLKNTKEWQKLLEKNFQKNLIINSNNKINILILHSNFFSSINKDEIRRTAKIIDYQENFNIGFRPHIRFGKILNQNEIDYIFKGMKSFYIFNKSLIEAIQWSHVCLFYGSSAGIDALCMNKNTIFLRYATANTFDKSLQKYVTICDSPEDLILELEKIKKLKRIENPKKIYPLQNRKDLEQKWIKFLST